MWSPYLVWSDDKTKVIARLPKDTFLNGSLNQELFTEQLEKMKAYHAMVYTENIDLFIQYAENATEEAYQGITVAEIKNAQAYIEVSGDGMLASITVIGAYGGRGVTADELIQILSQARVTKGINKLALRKVLQMSAQLRPGQQVTQPVAKGKRPIDGCDTIFKPLVEDITKRILKPQQAGSSNEKVDLRNLGQTITVDIGQPLMRKIPFTDGISGMTVLGEEVAAKCGEDLALELGKGTEFSSSDANLLVAITSGTPLIKANCVDVDNVLLLNDVDIGTGHISFKGSVIISGNIESGMNVKATGSITVGGFIESANVQAKGDISVGKGIIGHNVSGEESKSCHVRSQGTIYANYAQYSELMSGKDIVLCVHSMNNDIDCRGDLTVLELKSKVGTLSGGEARVAGSVRCFQIGVEGNTVTKIEAFTQSEQYKQKISLLKNEYKQAQNETMEIIRKELALKKIPSGAEKKVQQEALFAYKKQNNDGLEHIKYQLEKAEYDFEREQSEITVEALNRMFDRVTVKIGKEQITTNKAYGACVFKLEQNKLRFSGSLDKEDLAIC
ncbi:DUF342 domain-containing protein [Vibrio sagamiensis]|uniref:Polymerase n=1 Tax=Vibrio sagamiensis NBRC 104589 TaxID=1219064 RepID=A0A511QEZ8_9VIBR|nr:FapA family protein [Vibrio sagamiensis]PNQ60738.1 DUF342 domain-containing protein [Vibrio agarivorans]GEM75746.1 polymerase [Vibrio sagamiensis NBRC 104589]